MRSARTSYYGTVLFKVHLIALIGMTAVLALAAVATLLASRTKTAAAVLMDDGVQGSTIASTLELTLQRHRRIVQSAPAQLDRSRLQESRDRLRAIEEDFLAEVSASQGLQGSGESAVRLLAVQLGSELPLLFQSGNRVLELALDFVQDQAIDASEGPYAAVAGRMQSQISEWRDGRSVILDRQVALLTASAETLRLCVLACAGVLLTAGGIGMWMARRVLGRLERVKVALLGLARRNLEVAVPGQESSDEVGAVARAVQQFKDTSLMLSAHSAQLRQMTTMFETALENMSQGLCLYDADYRLQISNRRFADIYGIDASQLTPGRTFREVVQISVDAGNHPGCTADEIVASRLVTGAGSTVQHQELSGGRVIAISHCIMNGGGWVATYEDITGRRAAENRVMFMARHDALTGLPNRVALNERLERACIEARGGRASAVLLLDLDRFKAVNDTLGHHIGDKLLAAVSQRLSDKIPDGDMVARLGGDEFAIVRGGDARSDDTKQLANRVIAAVSAPFEIDGHRIKIGTSIGISVTPGDGVEPQGLLRGADMALYRAKADARGTFRFFEPDMDARLQKRRLLELDLATALDAGQFELFYQPVVDVVRGQISSFEALLRWRDPDRGLMTPGDFVSVMEDIGLIVPVGEWVIRTACAEAATWPGAIKVAVNLSAIQLTDPALVDIILATLNETGLPAERLELEITESVLLQDVDDTLKALHKLRSAGMSIAMDDFGTGYSSLSYLRSFPFDRIKIDRSFVRDLSEREDSIHVIRAVARLCAGLQIATTAEGVETLAQLEKLRDEGCTELQGYLFSEPKPAKDVSSMIEGVAEVLRYCCPPLTVGGKVSALA